MLASLAAHAAVAVAALLATPSAQPADAIARSSHGSPSGRAMFSFRVGPPAYFDAPRAVRECFGQDTVCVGSQLSMNEAWWFGHSEQVEAAVMGRADFGTEEDRWEIFHLTAQACAEALRGAGAARGRVLLEVVRTLGGPSFTHARSLDDGAGDARLLCCLREAAEVLATTFPEGSSSRWVERFE
jgi:hypothetical protein